MPFTPLVPLPSHHPPHTTGTPPEADVQRVVGTVMVLLGIDHLTHNVVGGDSDVGAGTGLGAGDRKLVNIAIELVSQVGVGRSRASHTYDTHPCYISDTCIPPMYDHIAYHIHIRSIATFLPHVSHLSPHLTT